MDGLSNSTSEIAWLPTKRPVLASCCERGTRSFWYEDLADRCSAHALAPVRLRFLAPRQPDRPGPADRRRRADAAFIRRARRNWIERLRTQRRSGTARGPRVRQG